MLKQLIVLELEDGFTYMALNICLFSIKNDSSIIKNLNSAKIHK